MCIIQIITTIKVRIVIEASGSIAFVSDYMLFLLGSADLSDGGRVARIWDD